jgi:HD-GYP domain-containing protein (c-di-GMP phosphodiesterase class II)
MSSLKFKVRKILPGLNGKAIFRSSQGSPVRANLNSAFSSSFMRLGRFKERARYSRERLVTISQLGCILSECSVLPEFYDRLSSSVLSLFSHADTLYIYQVDPLHHDIRFIHSAQRNPALAAEIPPAILPVSSLTGLPAEVLRTASPLLISDLPYYAASQGCTFPEMAGDSQVKSLLLAPMISRKTVFGILELLSGARSQFKRADTDLLLSIGSTAALVLQNNAFKEDLDFANRSLAKTFENTIESWRRALELRDQFSGGHATRAAEMAVRLGAYLGVDRRELVFLRFGAVLHDIGKIGIPDSVLLKAGPLEASEMCLMRKHPQFAFEMLSSLPNFAPVLEIPYYHHERWDGSGYPTGLEGEQIPLAARIFAVVDVWDALCSDRPYRRAWTEERALTYIRQESGQHFDPRIVEAFVALMVTRKHQN